MAGAKQKKERSKNPRRRSGKQARNAIWDHALIAIITAVRKP